LEDRLGATVAWRGWWTGNNDETKDASWQDKTKQC
jgi:hypothetical protein